MIKENIIAIEQEAHAILRDTLEVDTGDRAVKIIQICKAEIARISASRTHHSDKQARASKANGKKGGRPKKN